MGDVIPIRRSGKVIQVEFDGEVLLDLIEQFRSRAEKKKATSQISLFEKAMKARLAKEISKAA